jgi:ketosteroid isomerase-like protein
MESSGIGRDTAWAMSEENVKMIRRGVAAWNEGHIERVLGLFHPELEFRPEQTDEGQPIFPGLDPLYAGPDGFRKFWRDWNAIFEEISQEIERTAADQDHVVILAHFHGVVRGGVHADRRIATAFTLRDGLVWRISSFPRWEDALEAAGLSE